MQHKCKYYLRDEDGNLVCSVCGEPAHKNEIEDKVEERHEDKRIVPHGTRKISIKKRR